MATIRILATVCAALFAGLTLTLGSAKLAPAAAQTAAEAPPAQARAGRPLNLLPHLGKANKFTRPARKPTRTAQTKATHRVAQRRAPPARAFARRQNAHAVASREDNRSITPDTSTVTPAEDSLGYQPEGKTQPPIDAWLRSPLPAAAPAVVRSPATATRDRLNATAKTLGAAIVGAETVSPETVSPNTVSPATIATGASIPDAAPVDLSINDTVQVADAGEINEIDLAANEAPAPANKSANKSWLNAFLAVLGGAFAAAAAASFLFARRRRPLRLSF